MTSEENGSGIGFGNFSVRLPIFDVFGRPLAFEFGIFGYLQEEHRPHETYAALVFDESWRFGVVRPAYDFVAPSVFERLAPWVAAARAEFTHSFATVEAFRFNAVPIGLSYTKLGGAVEWMMSVHNSEDRDFQAASAAVRVVRGAMQYFVAFEGVWSPKAGYDGVNAKAGLRWTGAPWSFGLAYLHPDANHRSDAVAFDVNYAVSPSLMFAVFGEITGDSDDDAFGIATVYRINAASDISLALTHADGDDAVHLTYTRHY